MAEGKAMIDPTVLAEISRGGVLDATVGRGGVDLDAIRGAGVAVGATTGGSASARHHSTGKAPTPGGMKR